METTLSELKKQLEDGQNTDITEEPAVETDAIAGDIDLSDIDAIGDEDAGFQIDDEPWMDSGEVAKETMDVRTHLKVKGKLKGRLSEKDDELEKLKAELEVLKAGQQTVLPVESNLKRPRREDFDDDSEYYAELDRYEDKKAAERLERIQAQQRQSQAASKTKEAVSKSVEDHYARAAELAKKHQLPEENFQKADRSFRLAIDSVFKGAGDIYADSFIHILGDGSEKVLYHLGVNETSRSRFQTLLLEDPNGLRATAFLGQLKERLTKQTKQAISRAPAPAPDVRGNARQISATEKKLKAAFETAMASNDLQKALDVRRKARAAKIDVSGW